jgi:hypothetical protein
VALNTTEAEFIAVSEASKELLWLKILACELGFKQDKYVLFYDNQSAIHLSKNASFHLRSKHIEVRYHWIRNVLSSKQLQFEKVHTDDNGADMLTKVVIRAKLDVCRQLAGILPVSSETLYDVGRGSLLGHVPPHRGVLAAQHQPK